MIIENLNGLTVLYAEGNNKITNAERSLFANIVYLGKNDSVENYQEVSRDIWRNFIEDKSTELDSLNELDNLNEKVEKLQCYIIHLEESSKKKDQELLKLKNRLDLL